MKEPIYFDDSLPSFASLVKSEWGPEALSENLFLRDVTGRLTFVVLTNRSLESRQILAEKALEQLSAYVDSEGFAVATPDELFDDRLKELSNARSVPLESPTFLGNVFLVDRRMVGADWLRNPAPYSAPPVRLVFASLKGGVGRSTALCVLAAHLSAQGRRVLAIDMDLEAPGLGNMLLPDDTLPDFGLLDFLVERSLKPLDDQFYADMVGSSWLGGGHGRVDVVPAIGKRSLKNPSNVLAKIARAYLGGPELRGNNTGELSTFTDHMCLLLDRVADPLRYDVVLIDARAGLHETTAAAVVGLGAEVLLFGIDQPQTFAGYDLLFAHLAAFSIDASGDWRNRFRIVHAKAPQSLDSRSRFAQEMDVLALKYFWPSSTASDTLIDVSTLKDTFEVDWTEEALVKPTPENDIGEGPSPIIAILDDAQFSSFDPISDRDLLAERVYSAVFGELMEAGTALVDAAMKRD